MAIKTVFETAEEVPEALKEHSREVDGKFFIDVEDIEEHPKVINLRNAYRKEQEKRKLQGQELADAKSKIETIPEDFDPEKWEAAKKHKPGDDDAKRQELRASLEKQWAAEKKQLQDQLATKDQFLERIIKQDRLREGLVAAGIAKEFLPGAMALLLPRVNIKQENDNFLDNVDTDMGPVSAADYARQWAGTDEGRPYVAKAQGPDLKGSRGSDSGEKNPFSKEHFNMTEQTILIAKDPAKAERLRAAASR